MRWEQPGAGSGRSPISCRLPSRQAQELTRAGFDKHGRPECSSHRPYAQGQAAATCSCQLLPILLMFVIFYFLLFRPQQQRMKAHREMVENLRRGDTVVTAGRPRREGHAGQGRCRDRGRAGRQYARAGDQAAPLPMCARRANRSRSEAGRRLTVGDLRRVVMVSSRLEETVRR